jgi:hypothetical protein
VNAQGIGEYSLKTTGSQSLRISTAKQAKKLTPAQKRFNTLIARIDRQRELLAQWQELIPNYQAEVLNSFQPLRDGFAGLQAQMVELLDGYCFSIKFTPLQKDKVSQIIADICDELINDHGRDDLKPIANRHSDIDFDDLRSQRQVMGDDVFRAMLDGEFDLDPDDVELDMHDPFGAAERLRGIVDEQERIAEEQRPRRKKTARQLAKEQFEKEEESKISQSIRAVYRQLVGALHPDRELDPAERERKTDLMQKVTVAYKNSDLLQLLELQLTVEQIDQSAIDSINEDRLTYFNKILQRQSQELKREIEDIELDIGIAAGFAPFELITPKKIMSSLKKDKKQLEIAIAGIREDLRTFQDIRALKRWLKSYELADDLFSEYF